MKENLEEFSGCTLLERQTVDLVGEGAPQKWCVRNLKTEQARDGNPRVVVY